MRLWLLLALLCAETVPADTDDEPDPDDAGPTDEDSPSDDDEEIRDPEKKALHEEAAKWRRRFREAESRIAELEAGTGPVSDDLRSARLENGFLRAAIASERQVADLDTAWTLGHVRGFFDAVTVTDDGEVEGMPEALDQIVSRYPFVADADSSPPVEEPRGARNTGRPPNPRRSSEATSLAALGRRFPALKRRH